jgi:flagellar biosynthesis/type III secretory pathway protein FliH
MSNHLDNNKALLQSGTSHRFPAFHHNNVSRDGTDHSDEKFKPLFTPGGDDYSRFSPSGTKTDNKIDQEKKDEVCRLSFEKGLHDGKQEACRLSKEATEPGLIDFLQAVENISAFHSHVVETASNQIIQMAIKICERILSSQVKLSKQKSDALRDEIQHNLSQNHRLALSLEQKDMEAIRELTSCFHLAWPDSGAVTIENDSGLRQGQIVTKTHADNPGIESSLATRLQAILSDPQDTEP